MDSLEKSLFATSKKRCERNENNEMEINCSESNTIDNSSVCNRRNKRNKISFVWNYFKRSNDGKIAKCNICGKEYKTSGNTSNLADHIKRFHSLTNKFDSEETVIPGTSSSSNNPISVRSNYRSISPIFKRTLLYENSSQRKKELDQALTMMIATDLQPFNIVDNIGFKKFVQLLDPKYALPSKFTVKENLMRNLYLQGCNKLKEMLNVTKYIAITTDSWTSMTTESYLSVTCHFIQENYELKTAILSTKSLTENHTAQNISNALLQVFQEWNINDKITCIVTDNATNMIKTCEILKKKHLSCYAHTLNLVVQDNLNLDPIKNIINKCKDIVKFIKSSTVATETFKQQQKNEFQDIPENSYKLVQEVPTRWNSSLNMIRRILKTQNALNQTLLKLKKAPSPLTAEEIMILTDIQNCLDCFEEAMNRVSSSQHITVSLIIPITYGIYNNLENYLIKIASEEGKIFCHGLIESVKRRLFIYESRTVPRISTILDPRFKKEGFRSQENANQAAVFLENEMNILMKISNNNTKLTASSPKKSLLSFIEERNEEKSKSVQADVIIRKRQYLERKNSPEDSNPLLYWKGNEELDPLPELSQKYLCIPASSVESERTFSTTGQIISDRRSRLKSKNVNMLTFLNKNQWLLLNYINYKRTACCKNTYI